MINMNSLFLNQEFNMELKKVLSGLVSMMFISSPIVSRGMNFNKQSNDINNDNIEDSKEQENEDICVICNYPLSDKKDDLEELHCDSIELDCGHTFGYGCLQAYLAELVKKGVRNRKSQSMFTLCCPICKREASAEEVQELLNTQNLFSNYPVKEKSEFYEKLATSLAKRCYNQEKTLNKKTSEKDYRELKKKFNKLQKDDKQLKKQLKQLKFEERDWRNDCFRQMDKNAELKLECEGLKEKYEINENSNELSRWATKAALLFALGVISCV